MRKLERATRWGDGSCCFPSFMLAPPRGALRMVPMPLKREFNVGYGRATDSSGGVLRTVKLEQACTHLQGHSSLGALSRSSFLS